MTNSWSSGHGQTDRPLPSCTDDTSTRCTPLPTADRDLVKLPRRPPRQLSRRRCDRSPRSNGAPPAFARGSTESHRMKLQTSIDGPLLPRGREARPPCANSLPMSMRESRQTSMALRTPSHCATRSTNCRSVTEKQSHCVTSVACRPTKPRSQWAVPSRCWRSRCIAPSARCARSFR